MAGYFHNVASRIRYCKKPVAPLVTILDEEPTSLTHETAILSERSFANDWNRPEQDPSTGSVDLVPFPFSDLSQSKLRPAVVLASGDRDGWVFWQVTRKRYGDRRALELYGADEGP
jgi:hypothetical protein